MSLSLRNLLLAGAAGLTLVACGGGTTTSPGSTAPVTIGTGGGSTPTAADVDLVPNDNCPTGTTLETITKNNSTVQACTIVGTITSNLTLTAENGYALDGAVFVGEDGGAAAALTIPAGTRIFGKAGEDYLVVARGSRLNANGTSTDPVIMTSIEDIQGTAGATDRGQWGGLVINGRGQINDCIDGNATGGTDACEKSGEGSSGLFGGSNNADNSGTLNYVQVKFAGNLINNDDELNGIAFQGVGSGTSCDFVQVHNNEDDGVEFFGGAVKCDHLVLTGIGDDSLDWTDGWVGGSQFVLVKQAADNGDRAIEADNRGGSSGNRDAMPRSNPTIANFTFLGGAAGDTGIVVRAGTDAKICNGVVTGFQDAGFDIDEDATIARAQGGTLTINSVLLDNNDNVESGDSSETFDTEAFFNAGANNVQATNSLNNEFFPGAAESAVQACDLSADAGFQNVDYIGAFSPSETPTSNWASGWTYGLFSTPTECPAGTLSTGETVTSSNADTNGKKICELAGTVTSDVSLNSNFVYQLDGAVFIGEDAGPDAANPTAGASSANLTIDPGTYIFGRSGEDYLVVTRGSQIRSNGTAASPVVMTSREAVFGTENQATDRAKWGGLIINGRGQINDCIDGTAAGGTTGCEKSGEGSSGLFGGADNTDNSGNLFYTRVEYAGNLINNDDELNGIAFQAVGSGTQVDFVQVHNNADDGVEFFGGAVNAKHLVLTGIGDDSVDWTDGWVGSAQYVIVIQSSDTGDRGIEGDNRGGSSGNRDALPRSKPAISNFTFIGGASGDTGIMVRAGTAANIANGIITGFQDAGIDIDEDATVAQAAAGELTFDSIYSVGNNADIESDGDAGDAALIAALAAGANNFIGSQQNPAVTTTTLSGTPTVVPGSQESGVTATDPSTLNSNLDASATYVGAVRDSADTWYQGWTLLVDQ